ncbi:MAG: VOC family protein [Spirosomataceae bacterium]
MNPKKQFESYFLTFDSGARLEVMQKVEIPNNQHDRYMQAIGLAHFALSVGSKEKVDSLTHQLQADGYEIVSAPRWTGDGYYESVVFDPEKNQIELTI